MKRHQRAEDYFKVSKKLIAHNFCNLLSEPTLKTKWQRKDLDLIEILLMTPLLSQNKESTIYLEPDLS